MLRNTPAAARERMYGAAYDAIFAAHFERQPEVLDFGATAGMLPFLLSCTIPGQRVMEIGCGTGWLAAELARHQRLVIGCDVSAVALERARQRHTGIRGLTFEHLDGFELPAIPGSVDFCYSVEVLEHLHEEDVAPHLREVARSLKWRGSYWIHTPHRAVHRSAESRFGLAATGSPAADIHLKEWTYGELRRELRCCGFDRVAQVSWHGSARLGHPLVIPTLPARLAEQLASRVALRRALLEPCGLVSCSILARAA